MGNIPRVRDPQVVSQMPESVYDLQVVQFPHGLGGNLGGGHPVEVADAPEADEYHAEEVLVEHDEVSPDPLRPVVEVARHLAHAPEAAEAKLGVLPAVLFLFPVAALGEPEGLGRVGGPELRLEGVDLGIAAQIQVLKSGLK